MKVSILSLSFLGVIFSFSLAQAKTLEQVTAAECTSESGSRLVMDRETSVLEATLGGIDFSNLADGERMPLEFMELYDEVSGWGGLVINSEARKLGSVFLAAIGQVELPDEAQMYLFYLDYEGDVLQDVATCQLSFE